jgi:hypothetical protein
MRQQHGGTRFPPEETTSPATTRIGSGVSARLVALVAVMVLGGVVFVAVGSRPPARDPAARPSFSPLAQATPMPPIGPTDGPTATPGRPLHGRPSRPRVPTILLGADAFAVISQIEGQTYLHVLQEHEPGRLSGEFRAPFLEWDADGYTLELAQLWTRDERRRNYVALGSWQVDLRPLVPENASGTTILRETVAARPRQRNVPRLVNSGYAITVHVESRGRYGMVFVDVSLGTVRQLRGDDGMAGSLTGAPTLPAVSPRPSQPPVPLIVLTGAPGHPQRANRTHGESWYAGF